MPEQVSNLGGSRPRNGVLFGRRTSGTICFRTRAVAMAKALKKISLLLADVDGTLVTRDKVLTERALKAVHSLHDNGIRFAITSGRPPRGMAMLIAPLAIDTPIAGFNGGLFVHPDLSIIEQKLLPIDAAKEALDLVVSQGLDGWVYVGNEWLVRNPKAPHVDREGSTVRFGPKVVKSFDDDMLSRAVKIVRGERRFYWGGRVICDGGTQ